MPLFNLSKAKTQPVKIDETRYEASRILAQASIPSCLWMQDALQRQGVDTHPFDVWLLVTDIKAAADVLEGAGWKSVRDVTSERYWMPWPASHSTSLVNPHSKAKVLGASNRLFILLRADQYRYKMPSFSADTSYPLLPTRIQLLDGLFTMYLSPKADDKGREEWVNYVAPLILYSYRYMNKAELKKVASGLGEEQEKVHDDIVACNDAGNIVSQSQWEKRTHKLDREKLLK